MSDLTIEAMLKLNREEQERAAKHVLKMNEARAAREEVEVKRSSSLAQSLGVLLPWRTRLIGKESWRSSDGTKVNAIYYWEKLESLKIFAAHPKHVEAKRQYKRWYHGFHIVISEVIKPYGDGSFEHVTPNSRTRAA